MAGKPAATIGSMHVCPMVTGLVPHVGGPVSGPGMPGVLINGMPVARVGDMCLCAAIPDLIIMGSTGVFAGGMPVARMGDPTAHGGIITVGSANVLIGDAAPGAPSTGIPDAVIQALVAMLEPEAAAKTSQVIALKESANEGIPFCEQCNKNSET